MAILIFRLWNQCANLKAVDTTLCDFKFEEPDIEGLSKFLVEDRGLQA